MCVESEPACLARWHASSSVAEVKYMHYALIIVILFRVKYEN